MKRYAQWLMRYRIWVIAATLLITAVLGIFAAGINVIIDPATMAPQGHPYVQSTNRIYKTFGSKYLVLIGITPKQGDIFQPAVLGRVERITRKLEAMPHVVRSTLVSLAARQAKAIRGTADGFEVRPLLEKPILTDADKAALKAALAANPVYMNTVVSPDFRTAAILVELQESSEGFQKMVDPVRAIIDAEAGPEVTIAFSGSPVYLDKAEKFSERINWLFPISIVVIALLHFEAFRTVQSMILPLVTALMSVLWGVGFMGMVGRPLDIFNTPTLVLILAVAAGHAVQLLKRYYEEYERLRTTSPLSPAAANKEAVIRCLIGVGPVMITAGGVAALSFFSLLVFDVSTIRTFGIFTGVGILSAVLLEMTFIPAVRSLLKPPSDREGAAEAKFRIWDRIPRWVGDQIVPAARRRWIMLGIALFAALCVAGIQGVRVNNDSRNLFASDLDIQKDDRFLNGQLGGTNILYIMIEGADADAMKSPETLRAIESTQRFAESQPYVGKTISIVDYLKRMNQAMNGDQADQNHLPTSRELISQYLLLYSMSGEPGDFDAYVDYQYKAAKIAVLLKAGGTAEVVPLIDKLKMHTAQVFGPTVTVNFGGDVAQWVALSETMIQSKILNIVQIALAIFVISALVFRSFSAGVIVLLPVSLAVLAVFGVMGASGTPLNIPNSLNSAMAAGIGADYAIYLLYRMRELVQAGADDETAVRQTLATAGKASLFVATAVAGGYGVMALSLGFYPHIWLALFIVLAMTVCLWTSLTLVPSLALYLKPRFIFDSSNNRLPVWQLAGLLMVGSGLLLVIAKSTHAETMPPLAIMQKNLASTKVRDSIASVTFTLTNKDGATRVRKTDSHTRLQANGNDNMRLVRFIAPPDIRGTATLLLEHAGADDDMWVYLPAFGKVRRLSASNKKDSFVGTDFSYGDVIGHKPEEWQHKLVKEENMDGVACYVIESLPVSDAVRQNTGYSKRLSWIRKDNFVTARAEFWDLAGRPLKRITAGDIQKVGGNDRWQPMLGEAENLQTGHRTSIRFENFQADQNVPENLFTPKQLEK